MFKVKLFKLLFIFSIIFLFAVCSCGPDRPIGNKIQKVLEKGIREYNVRGVSAAVIFPDHKIWRGVSGVSVRDEDGYGVAVCPLDNPLVSIGEPGLWKFSKTWTERKSRVYVNLSNNMWNTNFPLWIEGSWHSRVRIWPLDNKSTDWDMVGPSWEARTSCVAGVTEGKAGKLSPQSEGVGISRPGVLLTAFGPNPYGDGTILRLWEQAGKSGKCTV